MSARVSVTVEDNELLAVKTARTTEAQDDLAHEAHRLREAAHPGVVALVEHRITIDHAELRTVYAGDSLERWRGTVTRAAGLVAAVAATLAYLHDDEIVHGRLDETHVLVGSDGRPRLCGFSPAPVDATTADDVCALGLIFTELLDRATNSDRRGAFRWPRAHVAERRALAEVVAHATDPIPERRPTARALARSILATSPDAELAFPTPSMALDHAAADPTSPDDEDPTWTVDPPGQWTTGDEDPVVEGSVSPDLADADGDFSPNLQGSVDGYTPAAEPGPFESASPAHDDCQPTDFWTVTLPVEQEPGRSEGRELEVAVAGPVDDVFGDQRTAELADLFVDRPWPEAGAAPVRPRATGGARRTRGPWRTPLTISFLVLAVAAVGGLLSVPDAPSDAGAPDSPGSVPASSNGLTCAPALPPVADVEGDGCPEPVTITDRIVQVGRQSWAVGNQDDTVVVGDWDCDGLVTPAAYRPSTGAVFVFSEWAVSDDELRADPVARVGGGRGLAIEPRRSDGTDCDGLAVEMANGERQRVEVGP